MPSIHINRHLTGEVTCSAGDFHEISTDDPTSPTVNTILANGAMHAMSEGEGHVVHEHITDDRDVEAVCDG